MLSNSLQRFAQHDIGITCKKVYVTRDFEYRSIRRVPGCEDEFSDVLSQRASCDERFCS